MAQDPKNSPKPPIPLADWLAQRDARHDQEQKNLYCALMLLGEITKARNVLECGHAFAAFFCRDCRHTTRLRLSCWLRLCPRCATRRRFRWIAKYSLPLHAIQNPTLLTLTFRSIQNLTRKAIDFAVACFAKLRRLKLWRDHVKGGMAGLEITWSPNGWHPHFHALLDATWISRYEISRAWKKITGGAWLVDIRRCDVHHGVREVAKYIAKGSTFYASPTRLNQFMIATKGRRFFSTFGSFYKLPPTNVKNSTRLEFPSSPQMSRAGLEPARACLKDPSTTPPKLSVTPPTPKPDILNNEGRFGPTPKKCERCHGLHLIAMGKVLENPPDPPSIQLPF